MFEGKLSPEENGAGFDRQLRVGCRKGEQLTQTHGYCIWDTKLQNLPQSHPPQSGAGIRP